MDSSAATRSAAKEPGSSLNSTPARPHWSQVGKGESFVAVFVEADKLSLHVSNVPVGEKVYLQRHPGHGRTISRHPGFVFEANLAGDSR